MIVRSWESGRRLLQNQNQSPSPTFRQRHDGLRSIVGAPPGVAVRQLEPP